MHSIILNNHAWSVLLSGGSQTKTRLVPSVNFPQESAHINRNAIKRLAFKGGAPKHRIAKTNNIATPGFNKLH